MLREETFPVCSRLSRGIPGLQPGPRFWKDRVTTCSREPHLGYVFARRERKEKSPAPLLLKQRGGPRTLAAASALLHDAELLLRGSALVVTEDARCYCLTN